MKRITAPTSLVLLAVGLAVVLALILHHRSENRDRPDGPLPNARGVTEDPAAADQVSGPANHHEEMKEATTLPQGFRFEHRIRSVGVIPPDEEVMAIGPAGGDYFLTGTMVRKKLTESQCLKVYNEAVKLGFFKLNHDYSEDEDGGSRSTTRIEADGVTKQVTVYGTSVSAIDQLVATVRALR